MKVAVVGANGYTGGELVRLLIGHPEVDEIVPVSRSMAGKPLGAAHPSMRHLSRRFVPALPEPPDCAAVFFAVPNGTAMKEAPPLVDGGKSLVIDMSADFRLPPAEFEEWYGIVHASPGLFEKAAYGLPELFRKDISGRRLIANPGCYPTGAALALAPLLAHAGDAGLDERHIIVDSKSGSSGAGGTPSQFLHFTEVEENVKPYSVTGHRHTPEMERSLTRVAGHPVRVGFTPHLVPALRCILTTAHAFVTADEDSLLSLYEKFYRGERFVHIITESEEEVDRAIKRRVGGVPFMRDTAGTNMCYIGLKGDPRTGRVVVISSIDNLGKGAAGQAIQNMNIVLGMDEGAGLGAVGGHP